MRKRDHCCRPISVFPSVTLVDCIQTADDIIEFLCRSDSHIILVCFEPQRPCPILRGTPSAGVQKYTAGGKILRFSTEIAVYLGNGTR